ncbi:MAG: hypothetical protein AAFU80_11640 [Pseudomonadota bacterium]
MIWNLKGDTGNVSRVVVLGAPRPGPWAAGVMGVPEGRVTFTSPNLRALDAVRESSCTRIFSA